jgi:hypothetical protein
MSFKESLEIILIFVNLPEIITGGAKLYLGTLCVIFSAANNLQQLGANHLSMAVPAVLSVAEIMAASSIRGKKERNVLLFSLQENRDSHRKKLQKCDFSITLCHRCHRAGSGIFGHYVT